jgi:acetyl-CoA carboxylase carboxyl transferase subunit alpha
VIGHEKGHDTKSRIERNFGMARPEGYRKAVRLMDIADRFGLPVITLVDTPGAYPGKGAEERGQSEAIARSTQKCLQIGVPLISVIIGEGGSGGAVAFATADRLAMLEHSIYSVISPEGCASILWKDAEKMREAAEALRLTAQDLHKLGVCDLVIKEPSGRRAAGPGRHDRRGGQGDPVDAGAAQGRGGADLIAVSPPQVPRHGCEGPRGLIRFWRMFCSLSAILGNPRQLFPLEHRCRAFRLEVGSRTEGAAWIRRFFLNNKAFGRALLA